MKLAKPKPKAKPKAKPKPKLGAADVSEVVAMALSDHVSFEQLRLVHGLAPDAVQALMRETLKRGSYVAWRKRVRRFGERRATYK